MSSSPVYRAEPQVARVARDWVPAILADGTVREPGTRFAYSNSSSHLLAAVLAEATGQSVLDYARQVLFDPLGITTRPATTVVVTDDPGSARYDAAPGFLWPQDPQGVHTGFGWAKLTARDMLALGQAPHLDPKTWYGFPSYARDGKVIVFFQPATKFDTRYGTVGFNEDAQLDDGVFWPTAYAVLEATAEVENALRALVRTASR